jgi:hypothetical protein
LDVVRTPIWSIGAAVVTEAVEFDPRGNGTYVRRRQRSHGCTQKLPM